MAAKKGAIAEVRERSGAFVMTFFFLFALTVGFLYLVDATPEEPSNDTQAVATPATTTPSTATNTRPAARGEYPTRVVAKSIGLDTTIVNPTSTDIAALDQELTKGAVRYPTSGLVGQNGTILLFGHSSYLPVVYHQYYKTFNGIQNLKTGATITLYAASGTYKYAVTGVRVADANSASDDVVELPQDGQYLTLITCDSFATKSNRFIVTAKLTN